MSRTSQAAASRRRGGSGRLAPDGRTRSGWHIAAGTSLHAIVVDDDDDLRTIFREVLEHSGWTVTAFGRAEDALEAALARPPHVVLTDVNLGSLSGRSLARALRADPRTERVAIVGVSGSVAPYPALLRVFDVFRPKPVDVAGLSELLLDAVARALDDA